jgi:thymidine kinase
MESLPDSPTRQTTQSAAPPRSRVELICGCMFSGKTTRLLELLRSEPAPAILIVKHDKDRRYSHSRVMTHNGNGCSAVGVAHAADIITHVADATEVVAIDEGHFYDATLPEVCRQLASAGKRVIVTALDLDMWGRPFPVIEKLKQGAGVAMRMEHATCAACGQPATHTYRKTPIIARQLVGGAEDFEPRCKNCWSPPPEPPIDTADMA